MDADVVHCQKITMPVSALFNVQQRNHLVMFARSCQRTVRSAALNVTCCRQMGSVTSIIPKAEPQTSRAEKMMRRFWKTVAVDRKADGQYGVLLDKRSLRTPGGRPLVLSRDMLPVLVLIAEEWENQVAVLKPHTLPMTSVTARAIDALHDPDLRKLVAAGLSRYLDTDTVCFHEEYPQQLVKLQDAHWKPLIAWASKTFDVEIQIYDGILGTKQSPATMAKLSQVVAEYDQFKLAAFERAVLASKSYLIALALIEGHYSVDDAARAAHVEVQSQIDKWGEVEDTHDVDHQDVRVRLGSAALLCANTQSI